MALKDKWTKVGHDFRDMGKEGIGESVKTTAKDFGKAFVSSVATAADKATEWAERDDEPASKSTDAAPDSANDNSASN